MLCHKVGCFYAVGWEVLENNGITVILKTEDRQSAQSWRHRNHIQGAWLLHWVTTVWCYKYEDRISTIHTTLNSSAYWNISNQHHTISKKNWIFTNTALPTTNLPVKQNVNKLKLLFKAKRHIALPIPTQLNMYRHKWRTLSRKAIHLRLHVTDSDWPYFVQLCNIINTPLPTCHISIHLKQFSHPEESGWMLLQNIRTFSNYTMQKTKIKWSIFQQPPWKPQNLYWIVISRGYRRNRHFVTEKMCLACWQPAGAECQLNRL